MSTQIAEQSKIVTLNKVVHIGKGEYGQVFCHIEIEDKDGQAVLSISGVESPMHNGEAKGSCGQIVDTVAELKLFAPGWNAALRDQFVAHWNAWHLNDMRAGCEHQRAERWDERPIDPSKPTNAYGKHFQGQSYASWNMLAWVRRDEHPEGLLSHPCPVCGYKYGSRWLHEPLPERVVEFMRSLPDTDIKLAWV